MSYNIMTISLLVQILILAALLFAIAELRILTRDLGRILTRLSGDRELRENIPAQPGQTINVNLSPVPQGVQVTEKAAEGITVSKAASEGSRREMTTDDSRDEKKSAPSGPFAVKCPICHTENSSYRSECFNCGNPLR